MPTRLFVVASPRARRRVIFLALQLVTVRFQLVDHGLRLFQVFLRLLRRPTASRASATRLQRRDDVPECRVPLNAVDSPEPVSILASVLLSGSIGGRSPYDGPNTL